MTMLRSAKAKIVRCLYVLGGTAAIAVATGLTMVHQSSAQSAPGQFPKSTVNPITATPTPERKAPIYRTVCRADDPQRCGRVEAFVGCGNPDDGVKDWVALDMCSKIANVQTGTAQAGRCGLNTWMYTCIPK